MKDYADIFDTPIGKRVMTDLEQVCFYRNTTSGEYIQHNEGMRTALLYIKDCVELGIKGPQEVTEPVMFEPTKGE